MNVFESGHIIGGSGLNSCLGAQHTGVGALPPRHSPLKISISPSRLKFKRTDKRGDNMSPFGLVLDHLTMSKLTCQKKGGTNIGTEITYQNPEVLPAPHFSQIKGKHLYSIFIGFLNSLLLSRVS